MRNQFANTLSKLASKNKKIFIVAADISPAGAMNEFQKKNPDRFINVGVAEQSMISICAGLAISKKKPFAYTIATFALYRPFEMIRNDLCYQNLPVTVVGMGAGTIYSTLGATHLSQEDISIARSIPNFQILAPCDPNELKSCIEFCANNSKKPTYLRIGKAGEKNFSLNAEKWKFGKIRQLCKGEKKCVLSYGPIISMAYKVKEKYNEKNFSIYSCHTIKPFDYDGLKKIFSKYKKILILEDHSCIGGLSVVKSYAYSFGYKGKIINFSLKDEFKHCYGSQKDLLKLHNITIEGIHKSLK